MTRREEIIRSLEDSEYNPEHFAEKHGTTIKQIMEDFRHISKSVKPKKLKITTPAECKNCEFQFKSDNRLRIPSKCPKCRCERIYQPFFTIK